MSITLHANNIPQLKNTLEDTKEFLTKAQGALTPTLLAKVLSWMPIANLVITHRTLAETRRVDNQFWQLRNSVFADENGNRWHTDLNQLKGVTESTLTPMVVLRDTHGKDSLVAKQYFLQTLLVVATVAIAFFGTPLLAGGLLLAGAVALDSTIGLNYELSEPLEDYKKQPIKNAIINIEAFLKLLEPKEEV